MGTQANERGQVFARQVVPATATTRAESRTIYLNPNGVVLRPGDNDSTHDISSIIDQPTAINGWDIDAETWQDTVDCMREIYAPFDVTITEDDPGDVPHIEAVFGGSPLDLELPANVAGVSPFTLDCAIIERSIVFTFTEVLDDDPRTVCEVMAQEVAHSFGLDHELLASDPMTYLTYFGERTFQNEMASCGEYGGRMCGINGSICRTEQNSFALLSDRLGPSPSARPAEDEENAGEGGIRGGCSAGGGGVGIGFVLLVGHLVARRRTRDRRHRAVLQ
ncbi:MAG TPA: hypothetical protein VFV99_31795 [Kofleriaceae bacterium]|nr:hypothetical protein [Kofleriaceae bacterium]